MMHTKITLRPQSHKLNSFVLVLFGIVVISTVLNWSCSAVTQPVIVKGAESDIDLLAGEWAGEYYSRDLGRGGSIEFTLTSGEQTAFGDVVMIPRGSQTPFQPVIQTGELKTAPQPLEILKISFVQISGGRVSGKIGPYWDPDNKVTLLTFFDGLLEGDTIKGTFRSRNEQSGSFYTGQWEVTRKK
jgi:hypothetical protein